jgi:NADH:ubiquinone oxidoreductase subunit 6 (subunit J)
MALYAVLLIAAVVCALMALRTPKLLVSALWLAGTSALTALLLYLMGAQTIAVVELSVGAGLVTILFVFAISVAGDESLDVRTVIPKPLAIGLVVVAVVALGWLLLLQPAVNGGAGSASSQLTDTLWQQRGLDVLLQIVLIFGGVMGVLGLLADTQANPKSKIENRISDEAHS